MRRFFDEFDAGGISIALIRRLLMAEPREPREPPRT